MKNIQCHAGKRICDLENLQNDECVARSENCFVVSHFLRLYHQGFCFTAASWEKPGGRQIPLPLFFFSSDHLNNSSTTHSLVFYSPTGAMGNHQNASHCLPSHPLRFLKRRSTLRHCMISCPESPMI